MPGIFWGKDSTAIRTPIMQGFLLANAHAAQWSGSIYVGDLVALSTNTNLTSSSVPVLRNLVPADVTASYQDGSSHDVGVLGVATDSVTVNASGQIISNPNFGVTAPSQAIFSAPAGSALQPVDSATSRNRMSVIMATPLMVFRGKLDRSYSTAATDGLIGGQVGFITHPTTSPPTGMITYTVAPSSLSPTGGEIATIVGVDETDPFYNVANSAGVVDGCTVYFTINTAYCQMANGGTVYYYSAQ